MKNQITPEELKTTTRLNDEVFSLFVMKDQEDDRHAFRAPFECNDRIYATDAHVLIRCDKSFFNNNEQIPSNYPKTESIFPEVTQHTVFRLSSESFEDYKTDDEIAYSGENVECTECDGTGEVTWEYKHHEMDADCPKCGGDGLESEARPYKTGNKTWGRFVVKVGPAHFKIEFISKLFEVKNLIGGDIVMLSEPRKDKALLFKINFCEVLIMPFMLYSDDEYQIIEVN